jgi:DNA-binding response OmpR family regulator/Tfp pilus assembly protein PilF
MDLNRKRTLVVDDRPGMLSSLKRALEACGVRNPHAVRSAHEAVARLRNMRYDLVLSDFDLGPGPDGQQLLEYCRREQLLAPGTVFVMVTAERGYDRVMSAAEMAPDDYLVKPFTEETLRLRLARAIERKHMLAPLHELRAGAQHEALLAACARLNPSEPRYALDLVRMKGDALLALGRYGEANEVFQQLLQAHAAPWARLGLARSLAGLGQFSAARDALTELLADAPEYLAAYDALAQLHRQCDNEGDAKAVLKMALEVSPNSVQRHKELGALALRAHDLETAAAAYGAVVRKNRHGFLQDPRDHLTLSRICLQQGKLAQALETLTDAKRVYAADPSVQASACALECMVQSRAENPRDARKALDEALALSEREDVRMDDTTALDLARACYLSQRENEGAELVRRLVSNDHDNAQLLAAVRTMYRELERDEQGETLIERCVGDAVAINNEGVARARSGDLAGAIELLQEAARTRPDNPHIVMNAAHALITHMQIHGADEQKRAQVEAYLRRVHERHPQHPKYLQVSALYDELQSVAAQPVAA